MFLSSTGGNLDVETEVEHVVRNLTPSAEQKTAQRHTE